MVATATIGTWAIQAEDAPAQIARLLASALLKEGVIDKGGDSFKVEQDTGSNMQIKVGSGTIGDLCVIAGDATAGQGLYIGQHANATQTLAIAASDASDDRIDRVIARVYDDDADSSGNSYMDIEVLTGTPAGSPSAPAVPDGAISLATIEVDATVTAIVNADITDTRAAAKSGEAAPGGVLGYAQTTSNVGSITTTEVTLATVTVAIPANRRIKLSGAIRGWTSTVANDRIRLELFASSIRMMQVKRNPDSGVESLGGTIVASFDSGAGGSIACTLRAVRHAGTGTVTVIGGADHPMSILVEDLGPALA